MARKGMATAIGIGLTVLLTSAVDCSPALARGGGGGHGGGGRGGAGGGLGMRVNGGNGQRAAMLQQRMAQGGPRIDALRQRLGQLQTGQGSNGSWGKNGAGFGSGGGTQISAGNKVAQGANSSGTRNWGQGSYIKSTSTTGTTAKGGTYDRAKNVTGGQGEGYSKTVTQSGTTAKGGTYDHTKTVTAAQGEGYSKSSTTKGTTAKGGDYDRNKHVTATADSDE